MGFQIGFDKTLRFTKLTVYLSCTWPPPSSATKWQIIKYNIRWGILFINAACIFFGMVYSIYEYRENPLILTQSACLAGALTSLMIKMITYRTQLKSTQTQIEEMEHFSKIARPHEKQVFRSYLARFQMFHISIAILAYLTATLGLIAPLLLRHQLLPTMMVYPFSVDSGIAKSLAFIQQAVGAYQCAAGVATISQAAVMMWFAGARLEILAEETKSIPDVKGIPNFVERHENRLACAVEVSKSMRYVALASSMASGVAAIMGSLVLLSNQPLAQKMPYVPVTFVGLVNLFMCAWPADNLIDVCHLLGNAVYNISWYDMPMSDRKNLLMIIQRCQRPIIVSVGGLLPTVSLRSYAAFLAAVYSYVTTLRAITKDETD